MKYYDGTKLLNMRDLAGEKPEIFICTTNRSAGKTTYFNRLVVNRFIKKKEKFILLYRYKYELSNISTKFFSDIKSLFFPSYEMEEKTRSRGAYVELFLNRKTCGYAIALNSSEQVRKHSHIFSDCTSIIFDEFQSEQNTYCDSEILKFQSIHTSTARGGGNQSRYLPVYMISNFVTLLNPYYYELGIIPRLNDKANFIRGNGWVLEQSINKNAADKLKESAFNRAFIQSNYLEYSTEKIYLKDDYTDVEKLKGNSTYLLTILFNGKSYSLREKDGLYYVKSGADLSFPAVLKYDKISINPKIEKMRFLFHSGLLVFNSLETKNDMIALLRL